MSAFDLIKRNSLFYLSYLLDRPLAAPDSLQLNFLYRCNLRCRMCSMEAMMQEKGPESELPTGLLKSLIDQASSLGIKDALLIGGEPFLRSDLGELIEHVASKNMRSIVVTNGTLLCGENLKMVMRTSPDCLVVSMDAAVPATMDAIRGRGVYEKIISNLKEFNSAKQDHPHCATGISFCATIMNQNIRELPDIVALARSFGCSSVVFQPVISNNCNQILSGGDINSTMIPKERLGLMEEKIDRIISFKKESEENFDFISNSISHLELIKDYFKGMLKKRARKCYAGYNRLQVTQTSRIYFCAMDEETHEVSFGDVTREPLESLWFSGNAKSYRKFIKRCDAPCLQKCSYRDDFENLEGIFQKYYYFRIKPFFLRAKGR